MDNVSETPTVIDEITEHVTAHNRKSHIESWVQWRLDKEETPNCYFCVTVPRNDGSELIYDDPSIKKITSIFDKYGISYRGVDTVSGSWNLNRNWIETEKFPCAIEYCGVYPVTWEVDDIVLLEDMENSGEIFVLVYVETADGDCIPNF